MRVGLSGPAALSDGRPVTDWQLVTSPQNQLYQVPRAADTPALTGPPSCSRWVLGSSSSPLRVRCACSSGRSPIPLSPLPLSHTGTLHHLPGASGLPPQHRLPVPAPALQKRPGRQACHPGWQPGCVSLAPSLCPRGVSTVTPGAVLILAHRISVDVQTQLTGATRGHTHVPAHARAAIASRPGMTVALPPWDVAGGPEAGKLQQRPRGPTGPTITAWMSSVFSRAASWLSLPSACLFSANTTHGRGQCVAARRPDHSQAHNRASGPAARQRVWPWASSSPGKVPPQSRSPSGPERRRASQVRSHGTRLSVHGVAALLGPSQSQGPGRGQGGTWVSTTVWKGGQCRPWSPEDADSGLGWGMGGVVREELVTRGRVQWAWEGRAVTIREPGPEEPCRHRTRPGRG